MRKGFFTQCMCILLERPVSLAEMESRLGDFRVVTRIENPDSPWMFAGPSLVVEFDPEVNGHMSVDVVDQRWPDHMGDTQEEHFLFGAWATGQFGPSTYPGGLERATQQAWTWEGAADAVNRHTAFVRLRTSYVFGAPEDAETIPQDYDAADELEFMTDAVASLLSLPGALCYFNPNGEVLHSPATYHELLQLCRNAGQPPLSLWSNIRLYSIDNDWSVMDTVGLGQLDLYDMEACFLKQRYKPEDIDNFLRDFTLYLVQTKAVVGEGNTTDGPAGVLMKATYVEDSLVTPPRRVMRWNPQDGSSPPVQFAP